MKSSTKRILDKYHIEELGYDFMGYPINSVNDLSYHHFLIPCADIKNYHYRNCKPLWDGVLLNRFTSHRYIHKIEELAPFIYNALISEFIDMKIKGYIDAINLININALLNGFESLYCDVLKNDKPVIDPKYFNRILKRVRY